MTVLTVATTAYTLNEQRKAASRNERFYKAAQEEEAKQSYAKRSVQAQERAQRARAERSRLRALTAETGLTGTSSASVLRNVDFQAGQDIARIQMGSDFDQVNSRYRLQGNLNTIDQPDYFGSLANAGVQIASYNAAYGDAKDPSKSG